MAYLFLSIAIVFEISGTSFLAKSNGFANLWPTFLALASYAVTFYFLSLAVKTIPLGVAYAIWAGAGIALITLIGFVAFGQKLDIWATLGIILILIGVIVIKTLSKSV